MAGMEQIQGLALQQTLSPQMQQSLHILQAPLMELRQLVTAELESNPTLEEEPREVAREPGSQESQKRSLPTNGTNITRNGRLRNRGPQMPRRGGSIFSIRKRSPPPCSSTSSIR